MSQNPLPLDFPPGVIKSQSPLAGGTRYVDCDNIRWYGGKPQKVGGRQALTQAVYAGLARGMLAWIDRVSVRWLALGTTTKLYAISESDYVLVDITPAGFQPLPVDPVPQLGWGAGPWGGGTWGTPRTRGSTGRPYFWSLSYFGAILLAAAEEGPIYSWDPDHAPVIAAAAISATAGTAPTIVNGMLVTSDLIVIAWGTNFGGTQDPMQWWASAQGDYLDWDVSAIAGAQGSPSIEGRLAAGLRIVGGADLGIHITLLFTDVAVYAFQYTGSQFVFNIERVGKECGLSGPLAVIVVDTVAYWAGNAGFYSCNGTSVSPMPNQEDILDWVQRNIPAGYAVKTVASFNEHFQEITFEFVPLGQTEAQWSVTYSLRSQKWWPNYSTPYSSATRYPGDDTRPIVAAPDGYIYQLDQGLDVYSPDGSGGVVASSSIDWTLFTNWFELASGAQSVSVDALVLDMDRQVGNITATLTGTDRSPATETIVDTQSATFGPSDGKVDFRASGRQIMLEYSGSGFGCDVRFGIPKVLYTPLGGRL